MLRNAITTFLHYYFTYDNFLKKNFYFKLYFIAQLYKKKLRLRFPTCTDFILLLIEIFGTAPEKCDLTGVAIDRACDVHPYLTRIGNEGSQVYYFQL